MIKILHITTHMGGGVGHAISDLVLEEDEYQHRVLLLQRPEKTNYIDKCKDAGVIFYEEPPIEDFEEIIREADVVILHWWHHPVMCQFLYNFPKIPVRLVLWSHISGCSYPSLSYPFVDKFNRVFFTSSYSIENKEWTKEERCLIESKSQVVYGMGKLSFMHPKNDYDTKHDVIKIGYTGTLTKSKIHPEFPDICDKILQNIPNAEFYLLGDAESGEWIKERAQELNIVHKIHLEGYVKNVNTWLQEFDIFGYPLNSYHFGTTENSILEAMAVGVPVVLMNQATEKYIITQNEDGILCDGIEEYVNAIVRLAKDKTLRENLGNNAKKNVFKKFSFQINIYHFQNEINKIVEITPRVVDFVDVIGEKPYSWFLSAVNRKDKQFLEEHQWCNLSPIFYEKSKSSIFHFGSTYPEDNMLTKYMSELEKYLC